MKTLSLTLSALFLFISTFSHAQRYSGNGKVVTEKRSIDNFDHLVVKGPFKVELTSDLKKEVKLNTDANLMDEIITEVEDKTLTIRLKKQTYLKPSKNRPISIEIPLASLKSIQHSGLGKVFSEESITANDINIALSGSGKIYLSLNAEDINIALSGSGKVQLNGSAENINTKLSGSGNIRLADLEAKNGQVKLAGSGSIDLDCSEKLTVKISGSGKVRYKEEPSKKLISNISGSGSIRQMK